MSFQQRIVRQRGIYRRRFKKTKALMDGFREKILHNKIHFLNLQRINP